VADADGNGRSLERFGRLSEISDPRVRSDADGCCCEGIPLFPPGPADADGWRAVLERWPDLAPAVEAQPRVRLLAPRTSVGLGEPVASRVEQLRTLGNCVVPACAALAWRTLKARLDATP
jgi:DNA (cytosine-5)-methyltransferase 1